MRSSIVLFFSILLLGLLLNVTFFSKDEIDGDQFIQKQNKPQDNFMKLPLQKDQLNVVGLAQHKDVETELKIERNEPLQPEPRSINSLTTHIDTRQDRIVLETADHREKIAEQKKQRYSHLLRKHSVPSLPRQIQSQLSSEQLYNYVTKFYGDHLSRTKSDTLVNLARDLSSDAANGDLSLLSLANSLERNQREMDLLTSKQLSEDRKSNQQKEEPGSLSKTNMNGDIEELKKQFRQLSQRLVRSLATEISRNTVSVN